MMAMGMQVLDLNAGLGGRVYAFEKAGFEIAAVVESNVGNCEIMASWMPSDRIFNINLVEVNPDDLPETDIITAKYVIQNFSVISKQTSLDKGTQRKTTENELPSLTQCTA